MLRTRQLLSVDVCKIRRLKIFVRQDVLCDWEIEGDLRIEWIDAELGVR
jgi:hypothetical protein